jgi:hypothetical protein
MEDKILDGINGISNGIYGMGIRFLNFVNLERIPLIPSKEL